MPQASFSEGAVVGFRVSGLEKAEKVVFRSEVEKHGRGPFRVRGVVEDRNGIQLQIETDATEDPDPILPARWFTNWEAHPNHPR